MSSRPSLNVLLLAAALGAAGCDPGSVLAMATVPGLPPGADADAWEQAGRDARTSLALGRWDAAAAASERRVSMCGAPDSPVDREVLAVELYNLACARSLGGHVVPALSAEHGYVERADGGILDLAIGDQVSLVPADASGAFAVHDLVYGIRDGVVEAVWDVAARGCFA